jgi:hypothetical protein
MATFTLPTNFSSLSIDASGRIDLIKVNGTSQTAADLGVLPGRLTAARAAVIDALSLRTGTAQAGAAGTITLDSGASATDDLYKGQWVVITSGTGAGQARLISGYVGSTKVATVHRNWATNPDSTSVFYLLSAADIYGLVLADTATTVTNDTSGVTTLLSRIPGTVQPQTGDAYARLGAPAGASVSADVAAVKTDTAAIKVKTDQMVFTIANRLDVQVAGMNASTVDNVSFATSAANEIRDAVKACAIDGTYTLQQVLQLCVASVGAKLSGAGTGTITIRDLSDTKNIMVATVTSGGRTAITYNV